MHFRIKLDVHACKTEVGTMDFLSYQIAIATRQNRFTEKGKTRQSEQNISLFFQSSYWKLSFHTLNVVEYLSNSSFCFSFGWAVFNKFICFITFWNPNAYFSIILKYLFNCRSTCWNMLYLIHLLYPFHIRRALVWALKKKTKTKFWKWEKSIWQLQLLCKQSEFVLHQSCY